MAETHVPQLSSERFGKEETDEESEVVFWSEFMMKERESETKDVENSGCGDDGSTTGEEGAVILAVDEESTESCSPFSLCSLG